MTDDSLRERARPGTKQFPCDVCGKMIWGGWFVPGVAGQPPSPVKCGACSNPQRAEILAPDTPNEKITIGRTETGSVRIVMIDANVTTCLVVNADGAKWMATELLRAAGVEIIERAALLACEPRTNEARCTCPCGACTGRVWGMPKHDACRFECSSGTAPPTKARTPNVPIEHDLKTWCEPFSRVRSGAKVHEIRKNDRQYMIGDTLLLREWDHTTSAYTGEVERRIVTWISYGGAWGLPEDLCVMSIAPCSDNPQSPHPGAGGGDDDDVKAAWDEAIARCLKVCKDVEETAAKQTNRRETNPAYWERHGAQQCIDAIKDMAEEHGEVPAPRMDHPRITALENALRSCIWLCWDCQAFATWQGKDRFGSSFKQSFCDSCKAKHEVEREEFGRHVGELSFKDWEPFEHNVQLARILLADRGTDSVTNGGSNG